MTFLIETCPHYSGWCSLSFWLVSCSRRPGRGEGEPRTTPDAHWRRHVSPEFTPSPPSCCTNKWEPHYDSVLETSLFPRWFLGGTGESVVFVERRAGGHIPLPHTHSVCRSGLSSRTLSVPGSVGVVQEATYPSRTRTAYVGQVCASSNTPRCPALPPLPFPHIYIYYNFKGFGKK